MSLQHVDAGVSASPVGTRVLISAAFGLLLLLPKLSSYLATGAVLLEDDAYYYAMVARNLVETGRSSFDGVTLTNGYHPLWMLVWAAQHALVGTSSGMAMLVIEAACCAVAAWLLLGLIDEWPVTQRAIFTALVFTFVAKFAITGMEVSLILLCFATLLAVLWRPSAGGDRRWLLVGTLAALCIGARLDMAAFVLPLVILSARTRREGAAALALLVLLGLAYVAVNYAVFGAALPVSGTIKSLGGLQINHVLLAQLGFSGTLQALAMLAGPAVILLLTERWSRVWVLLVSLLIGLVLYFAKLVFFSSWAVWSWYWYPQILVAIGVLLAILPHLTASIEAQSSGVRRLIALACLGFAVVTSLRSPVDPLFDGIRRLDDLAIRRIAAIEPGAHVALGDRAGHFAWRYGGRVTQLEGIVNDKEYLQALAGQVDLHALLCRRGVRLLVEWNRDLGVYETHSVQPLQPNLTSFPGPRLVVRRADEVARVREPAVLELVNGLDTIYVWRLQGCAPSGTR